MSSPGHEYVIRSRGPWIVPWSTGEDVVKVALKVGRALKREPGNQAAGRKKQVGAQAGNTSEILG